MADDVGTWNHVDGLTIKIDDGYINTGGLNMIRLLVYFVPQSLVIIDNENTITNITDIPQSVANASTRLLDYETGTIYPTVIDEAPSCDVPNTIKGWSYTVGAENKNDFLNPYTAGANFSGVDPAAMCVTFYVMCNSDKDEQINLCVEFKCGTKEAPIYITSTLTHKSLNNPEHAGQIIDDGHFVKLNAKQLGPHPISDFVTQMPVLPGNASIRDQTASRDETRFSNYVRQINGRIRLNEKYIGNIYYSFSPDINNPKPKPYAQWFHNGFLVSAYLWSQKAKPTQVLTIDGLIDNYEINIDEDDGSSVRFTLIYTVNLSSKVFHSCKTVHINIFDTRGLVSSYYMNCDLPKYTQMYDKNFNWNAMVFDSSPSEPQDRSMSFNLTNLAYGNMVLGWDNGDSIRMVTDQTDGTEGESLGFEAVSDLEDNKPQYAYGILSMDQNKSLYIDTQYRPFVLYSAPLKSSAFSILPIWSNYSFALYSKYCNYFCCADDKIDYEQYHRIYANIESAPKDNSDSKDVGNLSKMWLLTDCT